jgi:hypothetical protein
MGLTDAEEIHDLAVEIVQDLDLRRRLVKKDLCPARECFHVGRVRREHVNDSLCKRTLSSNV